MSLAWISSWKLPNMELRAMLIADWKWRLWSWHVGLGVDFLHGVYVPRNSWISSRGEFLLFPPLLRVIDTKNLCQSLKLNSIWFYGF